jgi:RNA polymerase sigma factor (sigma-70 family)
MLASRPSRRLSTSSTRATRKSPPRPAIALSSPALGELARRLAATEIAFIDHPQFRGRHAARWIEAQRPAEPQGTPAARTITQGLAFVAGLVRAPLLTPPLERYLFLKMNFLKFRADRLRRRISLRQPDPQLLAEIQSLLDEATALRNRIAESNLRLVVATAKKLSNSIDHLSELTSEGLLPLLRAVELFDVGLGNRFSTYATWAVRNQMHRALRRRRPAQELLDDDSTWDHLPDERGCEATDVREQTRRQELLERLLQGLSDRERWVLAARFGLDGHPQGQSLSEVSAQLNLSKERVRQIALQAVEKLRSSLAPEDLAELTLEPAAVVVG